MVRSFVATCLASLVLALLAASALAVPMATFEGNVFRLRVPSGESVRANIVGRASTGTNPEPAADHFVVAFREPVDFGPGCRLQQATLNNIAEPLELWCGLDPAGIDSVPLRYRFSFADGDDYGGGPEGGLRGVRGVIYAGAGDDIASGNRVFGGPGADILDGPLLYGGAGTDWMNATEEVAQKQIVRGGPGDDRINDTLPVASTWAYGGRGDDHIYSSYRGDMLVGGPGRDMVVLTEDGKPDLVRLRGGGSDVLRCRDPDFAGLPGERHDIVFADGADRIDPFCEGTQILFDGRPGLRP
jgi:hypothetical protein